MKIVSKIIDSSKLFNNYFEICKKRKIKFLVLHHIMAQNIDLAISELKKHQVSSHYIIDEDGNVFSLVLENNIAYHAGVSYWRDKYNLNDESIGIEYLSSDPYKTGFSKEQIESGLILCKNIIQKYKISPPNIVGHSDIAYDKETGFLNRKDDPSILFPWQYFANNGVGISLESKNVKEIKKMIIRANLEESNLFNKNNIILKKKLNRFGYKIDNFNGNFDQELKNAILVFTRRFGEF